MLLKNKTVVISGVGPGLGCKLVTLSLVEGANVVLASRTQEKLDVLKSDLVAQGVDGERILCVATDIADRESCRSLADRAYQKFGRIDVLINSAYDPGTFSTIDSANLNDWRKPMDVNFFGTLNLTQEVVPHMRRGGGGSIVMVNTMAARTPMFSNGGYASTKAALSCASSHLAMELGADNIRVNSVYMGWMWGPSVENYMIASAKERSLALEEVIGEVTRNIPLGRIPSDEECGKSVLFFASDYASAVTGATLDVNGGGFIPH
ncbi:SDR family oxidoreductase [Zhongshania aquimaris]|uniref:SDR family oxidoreductase n=1 Tax=Zhongshania aquimaris TaxID=2857107 RepID=A0ABS6VX53_9GAMM|nr:SDR family oxidoreductase [Zhongshania aquimaris]MBW2942206.1 SDR family oxidoreductase [Zhongshania aquimaris]